MTTANESDPLLAEQVAYYSAIAPEYEDHAISGPGADELIAAMDTFRPTGDVLELACGPGAWTARLLNRATTVTALDASPEMLARAEARLGADRVRFIRANLFAWTPDRRYDVVFFSSWISHVPLDRFDAFWFFVADCLRPSGRVFFMDDAYRTPDELIEGESSSTIRRRLNDGTRIPGGQSPTSSSRPRRPTPAARVGHHGDCDLRALLLGAGHAQFLGRSTGLAAPSTSSVGWSGMRRPERPQTTR